MATKKTTKGKVMVDAKALKAVLAAHEELSSLAEIVTCYCDDVKGQEPGEEYDETHRCADAKHINSLRKSLKGA